jgi:hypothetical protein
MISLADPKAEQTLGDPVGQLVELPVAEPQIAIGVDQGIVVRKPPRGILEQAADSELQCI